MLQEAQLFSLLDRVMNQSAHIRKGEEAVYFCPFCSHYKKKLEINVRTQEWHCWICNSRGRSIRSLFYKLRAADTYVEELYRLIGKEWKRSDSPVDDLPKNFALPEEFIPLWKPSKSSDFALAMAYLTDRGITMDDILRYGIGYCEAGEYRQRVLIPSYDGEGNLNFFAARTFYEDAVMKYKLPPWPKDIVGFELFINWDEPITLVEGSFDALAVRKNVIPLFGTTMMLAVQLAIIEHKVKRVNIVLDNDALKQSVNIFERIQKIQSSDIDIHLVRLPEKDPAKLGFEKVNALIEQSKPYGFADIIKAKLCV